MKRTVLLILAMIVTLVASAAEGKSTMELLINKEWYEFDFKTMKPDESRYVRYTGTQRLEVSADEDGNTRMRVQKYYLSYEWEERFDSRKVGKYRNGKYIVIRGERDTSNVEEIKTICLEIMKLTDNRLNIKNLSDFDLPRNFYVTNDENADTKEGIFVPTIDLLANKLWFMLDDKGNRTGMEWSFDYGSCYKCQLPENRYTEFPKWERREFYLSNEIVTEFKRKKVGKSKNGLYLVINDQEEDGEWQVRTYDIKTLSADRLMLECVYPRGEKNIIFESQRSRKEEKESKMKPQQKNLIGKEWYRVDTATWQRTKYVETFTETHITRSFPSRKNGELVNNKFTFEYYMSNQPAEEFDWRQKGNNPEGDYLVVNESDADGKYRAVNYKIMSLEGSSMFTINVSHPDSILHIYDRDKTAEELSLSKYVTIDSLGMRKSMKAMMVGKQWYWIEDGEKRMYWPRYYTETQFASPQWKKTKKGYKCELSIADWCLTNNAMNRSSSLNDAVYNVQWAYYPDWFSLYWFRNLYVSDAKVLWQAARHPDRIIMLVNE